MANSHLHNPQLNGEPFMWEGGETAVLLMHGLTATPLEVRGLAKRLHEAGYTVAAPLLPGHGTTIADLNQTKWINWVAEGTRLYRRLRDQYDHVFVGGESTGAAIALYMATKYPEIAGVLAYAPAIKLNLSRQDTLKMILGAPFIPSVPKESIDVSEKWQGYPENPLKAGVSLWRLGRETVRRLSLVEQPVLVMQGRLDTTIHPSAGELILGGISAKIWEHYWMAESSHVILLDKELEKVTELTLAFIERALEAKR